LDTALEVPCPTLLSVFSDHPTLLLTNGGIVLLLLVLSGLSSGSEVAFFSFNHGQVRAFLTSDDSREKKIGRLLNNPKRLLATILIVNNLINIFIVTISTYVTWQVVGEDGKDGVVIATLTFVVTALIIFFGEIIRKR